MSVTPSIPSDPETLGHLARQLATSLAETRQLSANAISNGHSAFFFLRADEWFLLSSFLWRLRRPVAEVSAALDEFLHASLTGFELGGGRPVVFAHTVWSTALALGKFPTAHFVASLPEDLRGLPAPPSASRIATEMRLGVALLRRNQEFARQVLEVFQGLCFDIDPSELSTHELERAQRVYPAFEAITSHDSGRFNAAMTTLLRHLPSPGRHLASEFNERIRTLGILRLAEQAGLKVDQASEAPQFEIPLGLHAVENDRDNCQS